MLSVIPGSASITYISLVLPGLNLSHIYGPAHEVLVWYSCMCENFQDYS